MSVGIYYKPAGAGKHLTSGSHFKEGLEKLFGKLPKQLTSNDLHKIRSAIAFAGAVDQETLKELMEAINTYGTVDLYAEY